MQTRLLVMTPITSIHFVARNLMLLLEKKKVVVKSVEHQKVGFLLVPLRLGKATSQRLISVLLLLRLLTTLVLGICFCLMPNMEQKKESFANIWGISLPH